MPIMKVILPAGASDLQMYKNVARVARNVCQARESANPAVKAMGDDAAAFYRIAARNTPMYHPLKDLLVDFSKKMGGNKNV